MITFTQFVTLMEDDQSMIAQLTSQLNSLLQQQQPIAKRNADLDAQISKIRADIARLTQQQTAQQQQTNQQSTQQTTQQPMQASSTTTTPGNTSGTGTPGSA